MIGLLEADLCLEIFKRLDHGRDVGAAMSVCRKWRGVFESNKRGTLSEQGILHDAWLRSLQHSQNISFALGYEYFERRIACKAKMMWGL